MSDRKSIVNAWTEWGKLEEVVVGRVEGACHSPEDVKSNQWDDDMVGYKPKELLAEANDQLDGLINILQGEYIQVTHSASANKSQVIAGCQPVEKKSMINKCPITVKRPEVFDFNKAIKAPNWEMVTMGSCANPRDVIITIGNTLLEAPMSKRSRFYEYLPYRKLIRQYWQSDSKVLWKAAPKPSMDDVMIDEGYRPLMTDAALRVKWHHEKLSFLVKDEEPIFDAADIIRCGKDIFIQHGMTTNLPGVEWLRREFDGIVRVHDLHFLDNPNPSHIDATFLPLRPPKGLFGTEGLALFNPHRPPNECEMKIFNRNNWRLVPAPVTSVQRRKYSTCSIWLSMNLLALGNDCLVIEEAEIETYDVLTDLGFDVITCKFDAMSEFGGGIHCATWDVRRDDKCEDFFPEQSKEDKSLKDMDESFRYIKVDQNHPFTTSFAQN